jgi:Family of unknown function (DUF5996)
MSMNSSLNLPDWPPLLFDEWENTCDTLHMWTQIVGKTRMVREPLLNHWWNVTLYVTPVGLTTSSIPYRDQAFEIDFDFLSHRLRIVTSHGREYIMCLYARSVADFFSEYMAALRSLGIEIHIDPTPAEFDDTTPYDQDQHHASYDKQYVERFLRVLIQADRSFKKFRSRFIGKCSPVHFFWGSFDLAVTRFSGRRAPEQPNMDRMMREGYSHEVISCGFWPGDRRFRAPAFYSYTAPAPEGLADETARPQGAYWDKQLAEFIYRYDDARAAQSPEQAILDFCQSTYEAGAKLAKWDRASLER